MNNIKNILKLSQDGGVTIISTNKSQKVIPIIEENLKNKFIASNTNLDLLNKTDPRHQHFQKDGDILPSPKECIIEKNKTVNKIDFLQRRLFAQKKYSVLLIFQGLDAAGKDGCIFRVLKNGGYEKRLTDWVYYQMKYYGERKKLFQMV